MLTLVAAGLPDAGIAACPYPGEATVRTPVSRSLLELGRRDRVQAVASACESGLVRPTGDRGLTASRFPGDPGR